MSDPETGNDIAAQSALGIQRRLHPLSWLFVLLIQLKQFAFPLIILLFTGRGDRNELWPLVGVAILAVYSIFQYFTYQYRVLDNELVVRSGVFQRNVRHIPFSRIQNVSLTQNLLHRVFEVAEVKLEAAGGTKPEAQMRVLSLTDARELEELIRTYSSPAAASRGAIESGPDAQLLLRLTLADAVQIGLINNRGMVVIGATLAATFQINGGAIGNLVNSGAKALFGWGDSLHLGIASTVVSIVMLLVVFFALVRLFSVALAVLQYYDFELSQIGVRLTLQRGLLSRLRSNIPLRHIQAYRLSEGWLHRQFKKRSLKIDCADATQGKDDEKSPLRDLVPLAGPDKMDALLVRFLASDQWPINVWQNLHRDAWKREFLFPALLVFTAGMAGAAFYTLYALLAFLVIPVLFLRAKVWAAHAAFAHTEDLIAVREGWLSRQWRFAEVSKLQGLSLHAGILDRRFGMASIYLDTAGARAMSSPFRIPYLPREQATILMAQLSKKISRGPLPF